MTEDFRERLAARKAELRAEKYPEPPPKPSYDPHRIEAELYWMRVSELARQIIFYAAIFTAVAGGAVVKDWWGFIGSREYHQYKLRVEK